MRAGEREQRKWRCECRLDRGCVAARVGRLLRERWLFENRGCKGFDGGVEAGVACRGAGGLFKTRKQSAANNNVEYALAA